MLVVRASSYDHFIDGDDDLDANHSTDDDATLILTIHGQPAQDARRMRPSSGRDDPIIVT